MTGAKDKGAAKKETKAALKPVDDRSVLLVQRSFPEFVFADGRHVSFLH